MSTNQLKTPVIVETSPLAVWRHAHFPIKTVPFTDITDRQNALKQVSALLNTPKILDFLNRLDGGIRGDRFTNVRDTLMTIDPVQPFTRTIERQLDYTLRLLISSVIRNDTGKKGSLNVVSLDDSVSLPQINYRKIIVPEPHGTNYTQALTLAERFNTTQDATQRAQLQSQLAQIAPELHEFHLSTAMNLPLNGLRAEILHTQQRVGTLLAETLSDQYGVRRGVLTYSVDYFLSDKPLILEVHCPPRTIATSYMGLRSIDGTLPYPIDQTVHNACNTYQHRHGRTAESVLVFNPEPNAGAMVVEAKAFITAFERIGCNKVTLVQHEDALRSQMAGYDIIYLCDEIADQPDLSLREDQLLLPVPEAMTMVQDRAFVAQLCADAGLHVARNVVVAQGERVPTEKLRATLGDWVLAKSQIHQPWWSKTKQRVEFLHLDMHAKMLQKLLGKEAIMVEEIITDSLDDSGYFGELRVFSTMVL